MPVGGYNQSKTAENSVKDGGLMLFSLLNRMVCGARTVKNLIRQLCPKVFISSSRVLFMGFPPVFQQRRLADLHRMQHVRAVLARPEGHVNLNILVELAEDRNHPVEREPAKPRVADAGEFGMGNAGQLLGVACRELAVIEDADNFCGNDGASLL
jgi:hypothetical protein